MPVKTVTLAVLLLIMLYLAMGGASASTVASAADTLVVTSPADSGPGTLRQALLDGQNGDIITFDPAVFSPSAPVSIAITSELPMMWQGNVTIDASDADAILDGGSLLGDWKPGLQIGAWKDSYPTVCDGGHGMIRGWGRLIDGDPNRLEAWLRVRCFESGEVTRFIATMEYLPDTNRLKITYLDGRFVICYPRGSGPVQSNATIVASSEGNRLWTSDFTPWDTLTLSLYESDHPGAGEQRDRGRCG